MVEMGVGMRITKSYGQQLTDGIFSLMSELGIWTGPVEASREPLISDRQDEVSFLNASDGGIFVREKEHGAFLKKGERIGIIMNPLTGKVVENVISPDNWWLFTVREYPLVMEGSLIGRVLSEKVYKGRSVYAACEMEIKDGTRNHF